MRIARVLVKPNDDYEPELDQKRGAGQTTQRPSSPVPRLGGASDCVLHLQCCLCVSRFAFGQLLGSKRALKEAEQTRCARAKNLGRH